MCDLPWKSYVLLNNFKFPLPCTQEGVDFALNYKPADDDVFVVTYPKSGTTWTQQIIYLILNNGIPEKNSNGFAVDTYLEFTGSKTVLKPIIKTHLPFDLMPYNPKAKYLFVIRNPKDTAVSLYYHSREVPHLRMTLDFQTFFDYFINGETIYDNYFNHTLSYWKHRFDPNVKLLVYEQMKRNPKEAVLKIGEFLGQEYVNKLKENNEFILNEVLKYSTIDYMKTDAKNPEFLTRKGIVGDWRTHFTKEESDLVDLKVQMKFAGTGLEQLWAQDLKW